MNSALTNASVSCVKPGESDLKKSLQSFTLMNSSKLNMKKIFVWSTSNQSGFCQGNMVKLTASIPENALNLKL